MTALPLRTRALSPSLAGLLVGGSVTVVAMALPEISIPKRSSVNTDAYAIVQ